MLRKKAHLIKKKRAQRVQLETRTAATTVNVSDVRELPRLYPHEQARLPQAITSCDNKLVPVTTNLSAVHLHPLEPTTMSVLFLLVFRHIRLDVSANSLRSSSSNWLRCFQKVSPQIRIRPLTECTSLVSFAQSTSAFVDTLSPYHGSHGSRSETVRVAGQKNTGGREEPPREESVATNASDFQMCRRPCCAPSDVTIGWNFSSLTSAVVKYGVTTTHSSSRLQSERFAAARMACARRDMKMIPRHNETETREINTPLQAQPRGTC